MASVKWPDGPVKLTLTLTDADGAAITGATVTYVITVAGEAAQASVSMPEVGSTGVYTATAARQDEVPGTRIGVVVTAVKTGSTRNFEVNAIVLR